jgi:hypothetical protein
MSWRISQSPLALVKHSVGNLSTTPVQVVGPNAHRVALIFINPARASVAVAAAPEQPVISATVTLSPVSGQTAKRSMVRWNVGSPALLNIVLGDLASAPDAGNLALQIAECLCMDFVDLALRPLPLGARKELDYVAHGSALQLRESGRDCRRQFGLCRRKQLDFGRCLFLHALRPEVGAKVSWFASSRINFRSQ